MAEFDSKQKKEKQSGAVLIIAMVWLCLLTGLILKSQEWASMQMRCQRQAAGMAQLYSALTDSAWLALQRLADDEELRFDYPAKAWAQDIQLEYPSGIKVHLEVTDEDRYFDVNNLCQEDHSFRFRPSDAILEDLLKVAGDEKARVHAHALQRRAESTNQWLNTWPDFAELTGLAADNFSVWLNEVPVKSPQKCLTMLPGGRREPLRVNVNTADKETLVGIVGEAHRGWVEMICREREKRPLFSLWELLPSGNFLLQKELSKYLDVRSHYFQIRATASAESSSKSLWVLSQRDDKGQVTVLRWVY